MIYCHSAFRHYFIDPREIRMHHTNDLGRDPVRSLVFRLAIPTMVAQFVNVLYSIVDRIYIGNIADTGSQALAGVGVCGPIVTLLSSFGTLIGLGGSILMAMKMGEKKMQEARQMLSNSFLMLVAFAAFLTAAFLLGKEQLLWWFGAKRSDLSLRRHLFDDLYRRHFFCPDGGRFELFYHLPRLWHRGNDYRPDWSRVQSDSGSGIYLRLPYGGAGAAAATVLSQFASCLFVVCFLFSKKVPVRIHFGQYSIQLMKKIVFMGLSPFLILATDSVMIIVMNTVLQRFGGPGEGDLLITCATIVQSYMMLISTPMCGITGGTQAIISYNYGARSSARVKETVRWTLGLCLAFTTVMFLLSWLIPQYFAGLFSQDPQVIQLVVWGIHIFTLAVIPVSFQFAFVDALTALGRTRNALFLSMFRKGNFCVLTMLRRFCGAPNPLFTLSLSQILWRQSCPQPSFCW